MQILSSSYPSGAPGAGLLLLRLIVAASLISESSGHSLSMPIVATAIALTLASGFLTTITAVLAALLQAAGACMASTSTLMMIFASIGQPLALTLLGPGAYSLDARLFGRRLIFESRRTDDSD